MDKLSVIIPARNEMFLGKTIEDLLAHAEGDIEVLAMLDGYMPDPPIHTNDTRVHFYHYPESIGQRKATNEGVKFSTGKYIMKVDAHCAFDQGFDVKMIADMQPNWTMIPKMRNLHAFNWVCPSGHTRYQSKSGVCDKCGQPTTMDVVWIPKSNPESKAYRFDRNLHFQYWWRFGRQQEGDLTETLSIQGSCFMVTKDKYLELDLCSEKFNSWGQQGVEVACKTWLSGGRVIVNRKTWYAHLFRTQGGDFGFPYRNPESKIQENRNLSKELFMHNKWDKAIHPFSWLIDRFNPPGWETIYELTDKHKGQTCFIVGSGLSIERMKESDFEENAPVIAINSAIDYIEKLNIKNPVYSMQKDNVPPVFKPKTAALLVSKHESIGLFPEHTPRYVFDAAELCATKYGYKEFSANCALKVAQLMGCARVKMIGFDSVTTGDIRSVENTSTDKYRRQAIRMKEMIERNKLQVEYVA